MEKVRTRSTMNHKLKLLGIIVKRKSSLVTMHSTNPLPTLIYFSLNVEQMEACTRAARKRSTNTKSS